MTVTVDLPPDIQGAILARANAGGWPLADTIVALLRDTVQDPRPARRPVTPVRKLDPGLYPDDGPIDEITYQPVPLPLAGTAAVRFVLAGQLTPPVLSDAE
jgi:hypothetical protein